MLIQSKFRGTAARYPQYMRSELCRYSAAPAWGVYWSDVLTGRSASCGKGQNFPGTWSTIKCAGAFLNFLDSSYGIKHDMWTGSVLLDYWDAVIISLHLLKWFKRKIMCVLWKCLLFWLVYSVLYYNAMLTWDRRQPSSGKKLYFDSVFTLFPQLCTSNFVYLQHIAQYVFFKKDLLGLIRKEAYNNL